MKKILSILLLLALIFALPSCSLFKSDVFYITDISDYDTEEYPIYACGFLFKEIPSNAEVISFSYYKYSVREDIYLEMRFNNEEELLNYLTKLKMQNECDRGIYEEVNPYDDAYTDLVCLWHISGEGNIRYTGYKIAFDANENSWFFKCNFGVASYSLKDRILIQSFTLYTYYDEDSSAPIPRYFTRFGVPINENHDRRIILENKS